MPRKWPEGWLKKDLGAGFTLAVMLVPQGMGYALLAGLPPEMGLYAATLPLLAYALLGSSPHLSPGPVAMISLLVFTGASRVAEPGTPEFIQAAVFMALVSGGIQLVLGLLRFGFLGNFLSQGVISGFTSASALIIALSQIQRMLGLPSGGSNGISLVRAVAGHLNSIHLPTLILSSSSLLVLVLLKRWRRTFPASLGVILLSSVAVYLFKLDQGGVAVVGSVPGGFPRFVLPDWSAFSPETLLSPIITITFVGYSGSIALARSLALKGNYSINPDRELIGLGAANLLGAFFSAFPVSGGFSRSAVNFQSGARTTMASAFAAVFVFLSLLFLTPLFYFMPQGTLAAIILAGVSPLIDLKTPLRFFKISKADGGIVVVTFLLTLFLEVEIGILWGIGLSLLIFIWRSAHPHTTELGYVEEKNSFLNITRFPQARRFPGLCLLRIDSPLFFANTRYVEEVIRSRIDGDRSIKRFVLHMPGVNEVDAESLIRLEDISREYGEKGVAFYFCSMKGPVRDRFDKAFPGKKAVYRSIESLLEEWGINYREFLKTTNN